MLCMFLHISGGQTLVGKPICRIQRRFCNSIKIVTACMGLIKCLWLRPQEPVTHASDPEMTKIVEEVGIGTNKKGGTTHFIHKQNETCSQLIVIDTDADT